MTRMEFIPARSVRNPVKYVEEPYTRVDIEATDHTNVYSEKPWTWTQTTNLTKMAKNAFYATGFDQASNITTSTLTKTVTIDTEGEYRLHCWLIRSPSNISKGGEHGIVSLYVDDVKIEDVDVYHTWEHWKDYDFGKRKLTSGSHTFKIVMTNPSWIGFFFYKRVVMYSTTSNHGSTRLGLRSIEFTENNVSELNTAEVVIMPRDDYFRPDYNEWSRMVFDYMDSITIYVGADYHDTKAKFGGYIIGFEIDDEGYITLHCGDRLIDFQRLPVKKNFSIGIAASEDETSTWPHINMSSAYETIRYLAQTNLHGIDTSRIDYAYGFNLNFGEIADYASVGVYGFSKTHDKRAGNPPPCLRLGIDYKQLNSLTGCTCGTTISTSALNGTVLLFEDVFGTEYDATTYDFFAFDYLGGGSSSKYPLQFNIEVTMYKTDETPDEAVAYNIIFTGKRDGITNIIHTYNPTLNGSWQKFKVDLKKLFDNYCQSSNYYITKIQLTNTFTSAELQNSTDTVMNIDNVIGYDSGGNTKHHLDMETNYAFDIVQTLADESKTTVYVDYGDERRKDVLVMLPEEGKILDEVAEEGFNILGISNVSYLPRDGFVNDAQKFYHIKKDDDEEETRGWRSWTFDSVARYGMWSTFEDLSDIDNESDAKKACDNEVDLGAYGTIAFSIFIKGTTILEPCQYLTTKLDTSYLSGTHSIKAIIHTIDFTQNPKYRTQIDLGAPSERFKNFMIQFNKRMRYITGKDQRNMYNFRSNRNMNITSPGAFIKTYTTGTD